MRRHQCYWTEQDDQLVLRQDLSDDQIAGLLERSVSAVRQRRWKLSVGRANPAWTQTPRRNQLEDVWTKVDRRGPDECWPWKAATRRRGYGVFTLNGRNVVASRVAFQAATGIDPGERLVLHRCDNPCCCNPAHLFLGDHSDNVRDMLAKGRGRPPRGSRHHRAKLDEQSVLLIRARRRAGEKLDDLAAEFGISASRLSAIVRHPDDHWRHVDVV